MKHFFKQIGFSAFQEIHNSQSFFAYYQESNLDLVVYYDKERGFISLKVTCNQISKEILPPVNIHDVQELKELLLKLCYLKNFLPKLYSKIEQYHLPKFQPQVS